MIIILNICRHVSHYLITYYLPSGLSSTWFIFCIIHSCFQDYLWWFLGLGTSLNGFILKTKLISKSFLYQNYFSKPNFSPDVFPQFCCSPWYNPRQDGSLGHSLPCPGQHLQHCHNKHTKSWGWVKSNVLELDNNYSFI